MRIGKIIYRLREKQKDFKKRGLQHTFDDNITGASDLASVLKDPPTQDMAFVIPIGEGTGKSQHNNSITQVLVERFGVVVCIKADQFQTDKLGYKANDKLHYIRNEIFASVLGWQLAEAEGITVYSGANLVEFTPAYLWYQFQFEYPARLTSTVIDTNLSSADIEGSLVVLDLQDVTIESPLYLDKIYSQYILEPDALDRIPLDPTQDLPLSDDYPNVVLPNIAQEITSED